MDENRRGFSSEDRLRKRREYLEVYDKGERLFTAHFVLYIAENNLPYHRLGTTVSRKIGKAVIRNRIKRFLREIFRAHRELIPRHYDVVVNVRKSASTASFDELRRGFAGAIGRWRREKERC